MGSSRKNQHEICCELSMMGHKLWGALTSTSRFDHSLVMPTRWVVQPLQSCVTSRTGPLSTVVVMYGWPLSSVNWVNDVRPALESDYCSSSSRLHCWLLATSFSALTQTCFISKQSRQTYKVCSKLTCRRKPKRTSFLSNILCGLENTSTYLPIPYLPSYFRHFTMEADSAGLKLRKGRADYGLTLFSKLHYITMQCDTIRCNTIDAIH